jgi:putative CocE/NonD family hydrolase
MLAALAGGGHAQAPARFSRLGEYSGYSTAVYDGWQRSSQYLTMRDGVRLAVDIIRPAKGGVLHDGKLPVVWTHHRYHRASVVDGKVSSIVDWTVGLATLVKHGYIVAAVDVRGGGASFGSNQGFFGPEEVKDAYEITEWLAAQPWSSGKVGMFGRSYLGIGQYLAASQRPPHLKAIFPEMAVFEWYPFVYPGGIYRDDFFARWQFLTDHLDRSESFDWYGRKLGPIASVDGDSGEALRAAAIEAHKANGNIHDLFAGVPYRNSISPATKTPLHLERGPATYLDAIRKSGVAVYHLGGWLDAFPRDALLWYSNLTNPQKLVIGPWFHGGSDSLDLGVERLRWFDYWLKGIDNGIMREPPIHYFTMNAPRGTEWRSSRTWPPAGSVPQRFYLQGGRSGSIPSVNDGRLRPAAPTGGGSDQYTVDYGATVGPDNRWAATYGGHNGYPDLAANDAKGLTYTTDVLQTDVEVTGHPVVHLWVGASVPDVDVFAWFEDVDSAGHSHYVSEGALRASHRALAKPPFVNKGLPWHPSREQDMLKLPSEPVELVFDLFPTSIVFRRGHRIRLTITGADKDNTATPMLSPTPVLTVHRSGARASYLVLPVLPAHRIH